MGFRRAYPHLLQGHAARFSASGSACNRDKPGLPRERSRFMHRSKGRVRADIGVRRSWLAEHCVAWFDHDVAAEVQHRTRIIAIVSNGLSRFRQRREPRINSWTRASLLRARPIAHTSWRYPASSSWQQDRPIEERCDALPLSVVASMSDRLFSVASACSVNTRHYR